MNSKGIVLSIIIPTRNRPVLLKRAVEAALVALPSGGEVIVVDDASDPPAGEGLSHVAGAVRVIRNDAARGAAGARNRGARAARGEVLLFLDDDDEVLPDYPARVLAAARTGAAFGFAAIIRRETGAGDRIIGKRGLATGLIPDAAPLRYRIAPFSAGFWIRKDVLLANGGIDEAQTVDEDTSLCCTLLISGHRPWYEAAPAVIVRQGHGTDGSSAGQLTRTTPGRVVLACYLRTWRNHRTGFPALSEARWFLAARYLRRLAKSDERGLAWQFVRTVRPWPMAAALAAFWMVKRMSARLKRLGPRRPSASDA